MAMTFGIHIGHMGGPLDEMRKLRKFADANGFDPAVATSTATRRSRRGSASGRSCTASPTATPGSTRSR